MNFRFFKVGLMVIFMFSGCQWTEKPTTPDGATVKPAAIMAMPDGSPYGTVSEIGYAAQLWEALVSTNMVGSEAIPNEPFFGGARPHGMILEIAQGNVLVNDHSGFVIVKKNYNGTNVSVATVKQNRNRYLDSITVMFRREAHYDDDNQNWFWAKYKPDGTLFEKIVNAQRIPLAGRLMKGKTQEENRGCIYCHSSAGGGDYVFYPSISVPKHKQ